MCQYEEWWIYSANFKIRWMWTVQDHIATPVSLIVGVFWGWVIFRLRMALEYEWGKAIFQWHGYLCTVLQDYTFPVKNQT